MQNHRDLTIVAVTIGVTLLFLLSATAALGQTTGVAKRKTITLGLVSIAFQNEIEVHFSDLVRYVAHRLSPVAQMDGRVVVASTALQMVKILDERKVDFYMESPYPTYLINRQGMALIILRRWKDGLAEYRSLIFANKSGPVSRLEDLRGKLIVFEDPGSTSGYFLPKMLLLKKGFKVTEKAGPKAKVAPGEIGYFFESTDRISIDYVLSGEAAAGAFSDDDHGALDASKKAAINVLAQSETLPRHLVSTRKDLDPAVRARLIEILLSMHLDDEGRKILQKTDNTSKFDRLPGGEDRVRRKLIDIFRFRVTK